MGVVIEIIRTKMKQSAPPMQHFFRLPFGTLTALEEGVKVDMTGGPAELKNLSRTYPWQMVPLMFVSLRLLVYGGGLGALYDAQRLFAILLAGGNNDPAFAKQAMAHADKAMDMIGNGNISTSSVKAILDWGVEIADVCPDQDVAKQLRSTPTMTDVELAKYMRKQFVTKN